MPTWFNGANIYRIISDDGKLVIGKLKDGMFFGAAKAAFDQLEFAQLT